jgi:hypothetical protein
LRFVGARQRIDTRQDGEAPKAYEIAFGRPPPRGGQAMLDVILLAVGLGFFALSVGYVYACDGL